MRPPTRPGHAGSAAHLPNSPGCLGIPSAAGLMERVVPFAQLFLSGIDLAAEIELIASDLQRIWRFQ